MRVGILYDRLRWEEKEISHSLESKGATVQMIDAKSLALPLDSSKFSGIPGIVLERCVSFFRGLNVAWVLEAHGIAVVNSSRIIGLCGNKLVTSQLLAKKGVPTPKTIVAFSPETAIQAAETIGYPCVMKPIVGSWGRQVVRVNDRETLESFIELRDQQGDSLQSIFYIQELVNRPPRDVRCIVVGNSIVACAYRYSAPDTWKTNVALGGHTEPCELSGELEEIVLSASRAVGEGILGVDVMECENGDLLVHEVNGTVEFRGAQNATKNSIADRIAEYMIGLSSPHKAYEGRVTATL
jgi:[lysine-biosynthesis-protein LysW]---L-2-aminoadipate ligase